MTIEEILAGEGDAGKDAVEDCALQGVCILCIVLVLLHAQAEHCQII